MRHVRSLSRKLARFRRLSARERRIFVSSLVLVPGVKVLLVLTGLRLTLAACARWASPRPMSDVMTGAAAERAAVETFQMVRAAARLTVGRKSCLPLALVTRLHLAAQGIEPRLHLGARKHLGQFEAHAWLELGSLTLDPVSADAQFVPFVRAS